MPLANWIFPILPERSGGGASHFPKTAVEEKRRLRRIAGFGEGTPQQDSVRDRLSRNAKSGTTVESCSACSRSAPVRRFAVLSLPSTNGKREMPKFSGAAQNFFPFQYPHHRVLKNAKHPRNFSSHHYWVLKCRVCRKSEKYLSAFAALHGVKAEMPTARESFSFSTYYLPGNPDFGHFLIFFFHHYYGTDTPNFQTRQNFFVRPPRETRGGQKKKPQDFQEISAAHGSAFIKKLHIQNRFLLSDIAKSRMWMYNWYK